MQVGVASISAGVQRAGGSVAHPGAVLDEALEQRAALIEGGAGPESSSLGWARSSQLPHAVRLQAHACTRHISEEGSGDGTAGFECLAEDTEEIVGLFSEVLMSPALPEDKLALYKSQVPVSFLSCWIMPAFVLQSL